MLSEREQGLPQRAGCVVGKSTELGQATRFPDLALPSNSADEFLILWALIAVSAKWEQHEYLSEGCCDRKKPWDGGFLTSSGATCSLCYWPTMLSHHSFSQHSSVGLLTPFSQIPGDMPPISKVGFIGLAVATQPGELRGISVSQG